MSYTYKDLLSSEGIDFFASIPLRETKIIYNRKLTQMGIDENGSALIILIPYYVSGEEKNLSIYAVPRDYHLYFSYLGERLTATLSRDYPEYVFRSAADNAPINEVDAAVKAGLGMMGDNGLFISPILGSYLFIGGIYTDMPCSKFGIFDKVTDKTECIHCGACRRACPGDMDSKTTGCLSAITQKKGVLTKDEENLIIKTGSVWGCDICQSVCPYNKNIAETKIGFFREERIPYLSRNIIEEMSDSDFAARAYSWRKRETVIRNIDIIDRKGEQNA